MPDPVSKPTLVYEYSSKIWRINLPDSWRNGEVTLYDLQGKEIYKRKINTDQLVELTPPITPGCYFVKIHGEMGTWSDQIVW